ncbi:polyprenol monophosphomannose synthase [Actinopolyspora erythraea]|uniref:Dolichol-phosphate mannosyltransferase n=1 Tax=Actinopolyspora erythraea TaxID=414996 RepID=A0A099D608_9ACTN|nr:polyprenol monophosphomannose synthase [Actinopolyspora erythraea]ASU79220.1 polyprenol monophosphomannose synthase [Actinopolyspora erythraea]KGI80805.1 dolichol-phosphate mannosyltransferase [Actinopolyspora erythraea]
MTNPRRSSSSGPSSVLVVIPTFNERDNLRAVVRRLAAAVPAAHVLVVDDNSPDGTGALADELAEADERVHVLHREAKAGLGAAYVAGFDWALRRGYEAVVEMDADGSHAPEQLATMLEVLSARGAGAVLGSRYVPGGRVLNWPWYRSLLSRGGNLYSKWALGVGINDLTGGFRVYRSEVLRCLDMHTVASQGYCFQVDLAMRAMEAGSSVVEVPITFVERESGESKMTGAIVREALFRVTKWGVRRRGGRLLALARRTIAPRRHSRW